MAGHTIRLRGAWETGAVDDRVRHARKFGRPRTLDPTEQVWLVCASIPGPAEVFVNGERIDMIEDGDRPFAADITRLLGSRNEVVFDTLSVEPLGDVALEIR